MQYKAGQIVLITMGEYSDFTVAAVGRARRDFDLKTCVAAYLAEYPEQREEYYGDLYQFVAWLTAEDGPVEEIEHVEMHVGSYGILDRGA